APIGRAELSVFATESYVESSTIGTVHRWWNLNQPVRRNRSLTTANRVPRSAHSGTSPARPARLPRSNRRAPCRDIMAAKPDAKLTPMMQRYQEVKAETPGTL